MRKRYVKVWRPTQKSMFDLLWNSPINKQGSRLNTELNHSFIGRYNRLNHNQASYISGIVDIMLHRGVGEMNESQGYKNLKMLTRVPDEHQELVGQLLERVLLIAKHDAD